MYTGVRQAVLRHLVDALADAVCLPDGCGGHEDWFSHKWILSL